MGLWEAPQAILERGIAMHLMESAVRTCLTAMVLGGALTAACGMARAQPAVAGAAATATLQRNVYSAGGQVRPAGPVQGDYSAVGGRVILDQPVGGDAALAGGSVDVRAPVGDDLRAAGGDVNIESTVGGEVFASGGNVTLTPAATVARGATLYGGSVQMDGRIEGELKASAQKVTINGEVRGDAHLAGAQIELGPKARIAGALSYRSAAELKKAEGASIGGVVTHEQGAAPPREKGMNRGWEGSVQGQGWAAGIVSYLALLACAAVFVLVMPVFGAQAAERIRTTSLLSLGLGFATLVAVPVLAVLLFITLLGIPLGIAVMALYPVLLLTGFLVGVLFVARLLPTALRKPAPERFDQRMGYVAMALLLLLLVGVVPFVGGLAVGLVSLAGIGAFVLEIYRRWKGPGAFSDGGRSTGTQLITEQRRSEPA